MVNSSDDQDRMVTIGSSGRGQSFAFEGIAAGVVVLSTVIFAIQATAVTPLSVSTSSQHVENQQREVADTLLSQALNNGTLKPAILYWDADKQRFVNATGSGYLGRTPNNEFGRQLNRVFNDDQIAVNVYVDGLNRGRAILVFQGIPTDNAVSASQRVLLMDDDNLTGPDSNKTLNGTNATSSFYAPDAAPNGSVYNVVEVRIVVWEM